MQDLIAKANTLLEALPYIQKFSGATFVVKYGGSFMDSPDENVRTGVARDIVFLEAVEINPVVVHGGGKAITRAMEKAGLKADFIQGQRVTDEATAKIVDDVLSGEINPDIVRTINALGGNAIGFAGPADADSLADTAYAQGRYALAERAWRQAYQARASDPAIGPDDPGTVATRSNLARLLRVELLQFLAPFHVANSPGGI